jgi:hypothetical protein
MKLRQREHVQPVIDRNGQESGEYDEGRRDLIRSFFDSLTHDQIQDPEKVAEIYTNLIYETRKRSYAEDFDLPQRPLNNVSIAVSGQCRLEWLTRRTQLIGDSTTLTHYGEELRLLASGEPAPPDDDTGRHVDYSVSYRCSDLAELGSWIIDCRSLLEAGDVFYQPDFIVEEEREDGRRYRHGVWSEVKYPTEDYADLPERFYGPPHNDYVPDNDPAVDAVDALIRTGALIYRQNVAVEKSKVIYPILKVDLPFVDEAPLASFAELALEYRDPLRRARDSFRQAFLAFDGTLGSEKLETEILKFGVDLRESIRELDSEYRSMKRNARFGRIGASLGTVSATLALTHFLSPAAAIMGAGGGGGLAFLKALENEMNRRQNIEERPFYFLWLLRDR